MCKTSHNHSPKPAHASDTKEQENRVKSSSYNCWTTIRQTVSYGKEKAVCIIGGESEALRFHQEATEESRKQQDWFCIKLYIIFVYQNSFILVYTVLAKHN